jgi:hypothetical protein
VLRQSGSDFRRLAETILSEIVIRDQSMFSAVIDRRYHDRLTEGAWHKRLYNCGSLAGGIHLLIIFLN